MAKAVCTPITPEPFRVCGRYSRADGLHTRDTAGFVSDHVSAIGSHVFGYANARRICRKARLMMAGAYGGRAPLDYNPPPGRWTPPDGPCPRGRVYEPAHDNEDSNTCTVLQARAFMSGTLSRSAAEHAGVIFTQQFCREPAPARLVFVLARDWPELETAPTHAGVLSAFQSVLGAGTPASRIVLNAEGAEIDEVFDAALGAGIPADFAAEEFGPEEPRHYYDGGRAARTARATIERAYDAGWHRDLLPDDAPELARFKLVVRNWEVVRAGAYLGVAVFPML
jgi:hypothetical protein